MPTMDRLLTIATLLAASFAVLHAQQTAQPLEAFINEFHYRNRGHDEHVFLEIVGPKDAPASNYTIHRYQGRNGTVFLDPIGFAGETFSENQGPPAADDEFGFITVYLPSKAHIRKGKVDGDGLCFVKNDIEVLQFISYNGTFTGADGPCFGLSSTDIGVQELRVSDKEKSLQLGGAGRYVEDFEWRSPAPRTPGKTNFNQTFLTAGDWLATQT
jgi:hypothetical protein